MAARWVGSAANPLEFAKRRHSMDMTGEYRIPAPRQKVWEALNDPEILKQCIPGCEEIVLTTPTEWTAKVTAKIGPVKARFSGKVTLTDIDPPNGYKITGEGTGGAAGFAKGGAAVKLADDGTGTLLSYTVESQVGGKLAQIGSRLIESTSRKMADDFFSKFVEIVGGPAPAPAPAAPEPEPLPSIVPGVTPEVAAELAAEGTAPPYIGPDKALPPSRGGLPPMVWIGALVVVVAVLLYAFAR
jgi:carbon monoxide dehydrogenase subunit G